MATTDEIERRTVSREELKSGVKLSAGHNVVLIIGGLKRGRRAGPVKPEVPVKPDPVPTPHGSIEVQIVSAAGAPQKNLEFKVTLPDGTRRTGHTNADGKIRLDNLPPQAQCTLLLPEVKAKQEEAAVQPGRVRYQPDLPVVAGQAAVVELPAKVHRAQLKGLHFETAKTFLLPSAMAGVRKLRAIYDNFGADLAVLVSGHTDTVGTADFNRGLSMERADSIARFLTQDVDGWMKFYDGPPFSDPWGVREDQFMLSTLTDGDGAPFLADQVDGKLGTRTQAAYKKFQAAKALKRTGLPSKDTRHALVTAYVALEGTTLPRGARLSSHGCGFSHLSVETGPGVDEPQNRRVEIYLFEGDVTPTPRALCPTSGCAEYPQWLARIDSTVDLDEAPDTVEAFDLPAQKKELFPLDVSDGEESKGGERILLASADPGFLPTVRKESAKRNDDSTPVGKPGGDFIGLEVVSEATRPNIVHDHGFLDDGKGNIDESKRQAPTLGDRVTKAKWEAKLNGARVLRPDLEDALDAYDHFLNDNGEELTFDYNKYVLDDRSGARTLESAIDDARAAAIGQSDVDGAVTETFTMQSKGVTAGGRNGRFPYPGTENWQKAIGGHVIWLEVQVEVTVDAKAKKRSFELSFTLHAEDRYNFNPGAKDIATGTPDAENGRFEVTGLGHEFMNVSTITRVIRFSTSTDPVPDRQAVPGDQQISQR